MNDAQIATVIQVNYGYQIISIERLQERASRIVAKLVYKTGIAIAKINTDPAAYARIKRDLYFAAYLATYHLRVPQLFPTTNGSLFVESANGLLYLCAFIAGEQPKSGQAFCAKAGELLGQLHALPITTYPHREQFTLADEIPYLRSGYQRCAALHSARHAQQIGQALEQLANVRSPHTTLIHTDFFRENLRMTLAGKLYLLDFDDGGLGNPLLDVGYFIATELLEDTFYPAVSASPLQSFSEQLVKSGHVTLNRENLQTFLAAYRRHRPLYATDLADLMAYTTFSVLWYMYDWKNVRIGGTNMRRFDWLQRNGDQFRAALRECLQPA